MTMKFKDRTRGGFPTGLYQTDADGPYPNHGWIMEHDGVSRSHDWTADGRWAAGASPSPSPYDLTPLREPSEAAVEAAHNEFWAAPSKAYEDIRRALRAAYEIDGIGGGE